MDRRRFLLTSLAGAAATPLVGEAQRTSDRRPRIVFLFPFQGGLATGYGNALQDGITQSGWRDAVFEVRSAEGQEDTFLTAVNRLVEEKPAVIVAIGEQPARTLMRATSTIPIIVMFVGDPVRTGLVKSLTRPGGNVTALIHIAPELSAKRLELLKELVPRMRQVGMLWNPSNPQNALQWDATHAAAKTLGLQVHSLGVRRTEDLQTALAEADRRSVDGLVVAADNLLSRLRHRIVDEALVRRLPTVYPDEYPAGAGGLASYGPDFTEMFRQAGAERFSMVRKCRNSPLSNRQSSTSLST